MLPPIIISMLIIAASAIFANTWQIGGALPDPYERVRPWIFIDFLRNFWLTG
jgi:hypothetical protein